MASSHFSIQALAKKRATRAKDKDSAAPSSLNVPSDMPTEHTSLIHEKYNVYLKQKRQEEGKAEEQQQKQEYPKPPEGRSPRKLGIKRDSEQSKVALTVQVRLFASI